MAAVRYTRLCRQHKLLYQFPRSITNETNEKQTIDIEKSTKQSYIENVTHLFQNKTSPQVDMKLSKGITVQHIKKETANSALIRHCLEKDPSKEGLINAIDIYTNKNKTRRGHIDFISTAMKFMEPYGLDKNIEVYNKIIDVFPREKFNNRSLFDAIWPKAHPQMFLALDILTKMEWQGIIPTDETHDMLYEIFGPSSLPVQKVYRFWFWFEEFKDLNPYQLPQEVYKDRIDVIKAGIDRILGNNDGTNIIEVSSAIETNDQVDYEHFIISSQTLLQQKYMKLCSVEKPLFIEGPIHIWMNHKMEEFFIMKTGKEDLVSTDDLKIDEDEEREGVILGVCFASKPYEETLQRWLAYLQERNPALKDYKIIFDINEETDTYENIQAIASS